MMIGCATPTVAPLTGEKCGGPNGAVPMNGVGSWPASGPATTPGSPGTGSACAGPVPSTSAPPNIDAIPAVFKASKSRSLVQSDIYVPPVSSSDDQHPHCQEC